MQVKAKRVKITSKRDDIVKTATKLFARHGFKAVSVKDITDAIGISSPSFYHHFPNKKALLREVLEIFNASRSQHYARIMSSDAPDAVKLKSIGYLHVHSFNEQPDALKLWAHILIDEDTETLGTMIHDLFPDSYLHVSRCAVAIDPSRDGDYTQYLILSAAIGYFMYMPLQNMIRRLTRSECDSENIANTILTMVIPNVDWEDVPLLKLDALSASAA